jgi:hypothetical protein
LFPLVPDTGAMPYRFNGKERDGFCCLSSSVLHKRGLRDEAKKKLAEVRSIVC